MVEDVTKQRLGVRGCKCVSWVKQMVVVVISTVRGHVMCVIVLCVVNVSSV